MKKDAKIVLMQLPYWTPLIPPQGIARLKTFLNKNGYTNVNLYEPNVDKDFKDIYELYFTYVKSFVPEFYQGNIYDNGHDLLRNHFMSYLDRDRISDYFNLINLFFKQTYLIELTNTQLEKLDLLVEKYFSVFRDYVKNMLEKDNPDVLGLSVHSGNLPSSILAFKMAKEFNKGILNIMGGSIYAAELAVNTPDFNFFVEVSEKYIDKIVIGHGEKVLLDILSNNKNSDKRVLGFLDKNYEPISVKDFEKPDIESFDLTKFPMLTGYVSKSCPNSCSFCNEKAFFGNYEQRDIRTAANDVVEVHRKYNKNLFYMLDVFMNDVIDEFTDTLIDYNLPIYFDCYLKVSDRVSEVENTIKWRKGGLYRVRIGVESGSQRLLDMIGKNIKVEQTKATLASLAYAGIKTTAYMVVGLPGETEDDIQKTLDFIDEVKDNLYQVEPHLFRYFYTGQANSDEWAATRKLVYPEHYKDTLITQTWWPGDNPSREVAIERLCRIVEHCKRLGVINPYTAYDKYKADMRWKSLHFNSVPSIAESNDNDFFENKLEIKQFQTIQTVKIEESDDFLF